MRTANVRIRMIRGTIDFLECDDLTRDTLLTLLSSIDLSVRTQNIMFQMELSCVGDLIQISEADILGQLNAGRKTLAELEEVVCSRGLSFGLEIKNWPTGDELEFIFSKTNVERGGAADARDLAWDFNSLDDQSLNTLLTPLASLDLSARVHNIMIQTELSCVGDLAQLTQARILRQLNAGRKTLAELEDVLSDRGMNFGLEIMNWPSRDELTAIMDARVDEGIDVIRLPNSPHSTIEEELAAVIKHSVPEKHHRIVSQRLGWKGGERPTLEELGSNPSLSGLQRPVTRERIRQLEAGGLRRIRSKSYQTPVLDRVMEVLDGEVPLFLEDIPKILKKHGLSKTEMTFRAISTAMELFDKKWELEVDYYSRVPFLSKTNDDKRTAEITQLMVDLSRHTDFMSVTEIEFELEVAADPEDATSMIRAIVDHDIRFEWLDQSEGIFWMRPLFRGKTKISYVCRKIFTVTEVVPFKILHAAIRNARTAKRSSTARAFKSMLMAFEEFDVEEDLVKRSDSMRRVGLPHQDRVLLRSCLELGPIVRFMHLREFLVRSGMSSNQAQVYIVLTPFLVNISRGYHRYIPTPDEASSALDAPVDGEDILEDLPLDEKSIEFEVTNRHLVMGTHLIKQGELEPGSWVVRDEEGADLGTITMKGRRLKGLAEVFEAASIGAGNLVTLTFPPYGEEIILFRFDHQ